MNKELIIEDIEVGSGREVSSGNTVSVHYIGTLLDGKKFDSSYDRNEPLEFPVGRGYVIEGWDKGLIGMKEGGKRKLTIPSNMAYGEREIPGVIPANSDLVFEVSLIEIK